MTLRRVIGATAGTYILLVRLAAAASFAVGKLGPQFFPRGFYAYVGSAFGPGGLAARLGRYIDGPQRLHWHIDYLLERGEVVGALVNSETQRLECTWANYFESHANHTVAAFGSSDCSCPGHLFFLGAKTDAEGIVAAACCSLQATRFTAREIEEVCRGV